MSHEKTKTHLQKFHAAHGKLVEFAGFQMPIWYKGILPEHLAVRNSVGIFDVTHMGRVLITGKDGERFLNYMNTNDVSTLQPMSAQYSVMCNEKGGIIDDFVLSRLEETRFLMVYNSANRGKNFSWLNEHAGQFRVSIEEVSDNMAMFAIQGPNAERTLNEVSSSDVAEIQRFKCGWTKINELKVFLTRTGYTGEDGFEVFVPNTTVAKPENAEQVWNTILQAGKKFHIEPCGLGARDTLRLEAGLCLYGSDIDEDTTPYEARISFVVRLHKTDFYGKEALVKQKMDGVKRKRVGLKMLEPGIPRAGSEVHLEGRRIGHVTSGTFSPLLKIGIAMAYIESEHAKTGTTVKVKIRNRSAAAEVVWFPLYSTEQYGYTRKN
ncbi:MAG: glycine cleavage system aminomethyltransferase GcvT [Candidatus Bathyarchaeota archaeon]|nr:MAG: glycine cleavage system aminomethyltransferase GcvT [Candidatus Bathyarchaeota archaeon]